MSVTLIQIDGPHGKACGAWHTTWGSDVRHSSLSATCILAGGCRAVAAVLPDQQWGLGFIAFRDWGLSLRLVEVWDGRLS